MRYHLRYWLTTRGRQTSSLEIPLDPSRSYFITGHLTRKSSNAFAQVYLDTVCQMRSPDQRVCLLRRRDFHNDSANIAALRQANSCEKLTNVDTVVVALEAYGGHHRAEGVIWEL